MPLLALPRELQLEIVERLDYESTVSLSTTNQHFRELITLKHFRQAAPYISDKVKEARRTKCTAFCHNCGRVHQSCHFLKAKYRRINGYMATLPCLQTKMASNLAAGMVYHYSVLLTYHTRSRKRTGLCIAEGEDVGPPFHALPLESRFDAAAHLAFIAENSEP
ncbi:hypothetical protein EPUS_03053 [Endocarpon pusillum Z07020]|uniref:F-box domain-containing protein n=1 Tax=Endocarpon pusillum (strain Z07020 / HMAS-L-300199) TaxID=1263415 RepID=U1G739_ENDPU|nr:uncharacterized protein EPUS_03053 [Endocarpon pusillum Z07020]ERF73212.1 hypothetical protein EPUS_03053 [Endocarpon pusillum Z07020]